MTTTEGSLGRVAEIVDEYLRLGLDGIFLRPLSPYGFAVKTKQFRRYDAKRWLDFYARGLRYVLAINKSGHHFPEFYSTLILRRMLTDRAIGYVDLRSPAGIGLGALVYNYDGRVFASDEGRMLAEMGDNTFELGRVDTDSYRSLVLSDKLVDLVASSLTQCAPECADCVFEPHCGADPVYHHATQRDSVGIKPLSEFRSAKGCDGFTARYLGARAGERGYPSPLGRHVMLPLHGTAMAAHGFDPAEPRQVLRLRALKEGPRMRPT
jgi:hypothetical protein